MVARTARLSLRPTFPVELTSAQHARLSLRPTFPVELTSAQNIQADDARHQQTHNATGSSAKKVEHCTGLESF